MTPPTIPRMCLGGAFGLYRTSISGDRRGGFAASLSPKAPPSGRAHCRSSRRNSPNRPIPSSRVISRHLRSGEDRDAAVHVEFEAAVGVHVVPDQGRDGLLVARTSPHGGEQPGKLLKSEEPDRLGGRAGHRRRIGRRGAAQNNCSGQFRRSPAQHSQAKSAPRSPQSLTVMGSSAGNIPPAAAQARFIASNG